MINKKGSHWTTKEKKRLREIMSDKYFSHSKNLKIASQELNRTPNACSWQWYTAGSKGKRLIAKRKTKRSTAIVEKVIRTPDTKVKEAKRLPILSIMRGQELLKVTCMGGTNGTTIYKADDLIIIVDTN